MLSWCSIIAFVCVVTICDCSNSRFKRIEERLDILEIRHDSESRFRKEGTRTLLDRIEGMEQIDHNNKSEIINKTEINDGKKTDLEHRINKHGIFLKQILNAYKDEKELNLAMRQQMPDFIDTIKSLEDNESKDISFIKDTLQQLNKTLTRNSASILNIENGVSHMTGYIKLLRSGAAETKHPTSCLDLYNNGFNISGLYDVYPENRPTPIRVYCDQETDGGGWTVFQRREDGTVDFYRGWYDYKFGFGNLEGEFWLGNEYLSSLTAVCCRELRIELEDFENTRKYAKYSKFNVGTKRDGYILTVGGHSGNAGDSLSAHNGLKFTTKDIDNDEHGGNCAESYKGGWWYGKCHVSNLNGLYLKGKHDSFADGVEWKAWLGYKYSLKYVEMKFR